MRCTEDQFLAERDPICLTMLRADGTDFLVQCGVWDQYELEEDDPPIVLHTRTVKTPSYIVLANIDGYVDHDRIRPLQYCTAGEFAAIDKDKCEGSKINAAILAYMAALDPKTVVFVYIS